MQGIFEEARRTLMTRNPGAISGRPEYDAFISYSHRDQQAKDKLVDLLQTADSSLRLYVDTQELNAGAAWQQRIFEALDNCRHVITLLSPSYLKSKICLEEYNIAHCRHRESERGVLLPIWLASAEIPTYMKLTQWHDAREFDIERMIAISGDLLSRIRG